MFFMFSRLLKQVHVFLVPFDRLQMQNQRKDESSLEEGAKDKGAPLRVGLIQKEQLCSGTWRCLQTQSFLNSLGLDHPRFAKMFFCLNMFKNNTIMTLYFGPY